MAISAASLSACESGPVSKRPTRLVDAAVRSTARPADLAHPGPWLFDDRLLEAAQPPTATHHVNHSAWLARGKFLESGDHIRNSVQKIR